MKAITITFLLALFSTIGFSQVKLPPLKKHSFEVEVLNYYQIDNTHFYDISFGLGFAYKYSFNESFGIRQSLRYFYGHDDASAYSGGETDYTLLQYSLEGVYSFGKNKSWETSLGIHANKGLKYFNDEYFRPYDGYKDSFGFQLGFGKNIKIKDQQINLGASILMNSEDGISSGLRLGYRLP